MAGIAVFLFVANFCLSQEKGRTSQESLNVLRQMCPYNDFCQSNATQIIDDNTLSPCCRRCRCDEECDKIKSCCPDKEVQGQGHELIVDTLDTVEWVCKDVRVGWTKERGKRADSYAHTKHTVRVVDQCPIEETDEELKVKCNSTDTTAYEDFLWVSDKTTGRIYRNEFCASCHGVHQFVYWDAAITKCTDPFNHSLPVESILHGDNNCYLLQREPPDMHSLTSQYRCFVPDITQCNETGRWDHFNATMNAACNSLHMPFIAETPSGTIRSIYKNIVCFMCNFPSYISSPTGKCLSDDTGKTDTVKLTAMLDYNMVKAKENRCEINKICDTVFVSSLFESLFYIPFHKQIY